ncbi:MAG: glycosyltransferase [Paracoccaceae bacterium]
MTAAIPKRLGHIWIGPKPAPVHWMQSWPEKHPDWDYRVYDNTVLRDFGFRTRRLIHEYFWRGEYAGVQDLMRYELLYEYGGFMADADAVCLHPVDELLTQRGAYTVYDRPGEAGRGVSPFLACEPGNPLVGAVIDRLAALEPWELRKPFNSTGNLFLMQMIREKGMEGLTIFPSHYFIPWHHSDPDTVYNGPDRVYAEQMWGSATYSYNRGEGEGEVALSRSELAERAGDLRRMLGRVAQPDLNRGDEAGRPDDEARQRADQAMGAYDRAVAGKIWQSRMAALNTRLIDSLKAAGASAVINGNGFYRHQQDHPLTDSPLMSRADTLRRRLSAYLAGAGRVMQIGVDAGHMIVLQKALAPRARIVAFDAVQPMIRRSARVDIYTPAAIGWLGEELGDDIRFVTGRPLQAITRFRRANRRWCYDILHINGIDENFLKSYGAAIGGLAEDGIMLVHDMDGEKVRMRLEELQMIGEVAEPVEFADFGPMRGALAVLRRRSQAARAALARAA